MIKKEVISLVDLAARFAKAKGLQNTGYLWLRKAPGRSAVKDAPVGNSLAVLKSIRAFNTVNRKTIDVYECRGYDGTPKKTLVISKSEIIRLKGFIARNTTKRRGQSKQETPFKIIGTAEIAARKKRGEK